MNSLPLDCEAKYWKRFLDPVEAEKLFEQLSSQFEVKNRIIKMEDGSEHEGETGMFLFTDANLTSFEAFPSVWGGRSEWPASLAVVRDRIESEIGIRFPVARCVYYRDGNDGMEFHSDPPAYGSTDSIASLSLGSEREFVFRSLVDTEDIYTLTLATGSLLYMGDHCQDRYEHGVPRCESKEPRINLTFRKYGWE